MFSTIEKIIINLVICSWLIVSFTPYGLSKGGFILGSIIGLTYIGFWFFYVYELISTRKGY